MLPSRPTHFQSRVLWSALTGIALAVVGALAIGLVLLIGKVLAYLQPVLVPLAAAGVLAYLLDPLVGNLENRGNSRLRSIIYLFGSAALLLIITLLGSSELCTNWTKADGTCSFGPSHCAAWAYPPLQTREAP